MKKYTTEEIKAYAQHWLKPALSTDTKDSVLENHRLEAFIHYIDSDNSDNIDNFLSKKNRN